MPIGPAPMPLGPAPMPLGPASVLLTDRVAVVTGGGSGIGAASPTGSRPSAPGWRSGSATPTPPLRPVTRSSGLGLTVDVRDSDQVDAALEQTIAELGPVDILVNNAGGVFWSSLLETTENGWDALYRSNLKHVILCTQRVARTMVADGRPGSVMSVTSIEGVRAAPGYAAYAAAKAGVINYTKTAALELAPHGIRVNALAPDVTMTEGLERWHPRASTSGSVRPSRWVAPGTCRRWPALRSSSRPSCRPTSPDRRIHVDGGTHAAGGWYHGDDGRYVLGPG